MSDQLEQASIEIEVPGNPTQPPRVNLETLTVRPGEPVSWRSNRPVSVDFGDHTPFVRGNSEEAVSQFNTQATNSLRIRKDGEDMPAEIRYKYTVVDPNNRERPPLDPYIIVRR